MKITFLGTGYGYPEKNRDYTAISIETGGCVYLFDAGASIVSKMKKYCINIENLKSVFVTHIHSDHLNGLISLVDILNCLKAKKDAAVKYYLPEKRGIDAVKNFVCALSGRENECNTSFYIYSCGTVYDDGNLKVSAVPTHHLEKRGGYPSYAFVAEAEGKCFIFSGDLCGELDSEEILDVIKNKKSDLFVCELSHFTPDDLLPHLKGCLADRVYINHIRYTDEWIPIIEKENQSTGFTFPIVVASDGDTVEL